MAKTCLYCGKIYQYSQSKIRHQKLCPKNPLNCIPDDIPAANGSPTTIQITNNTTTNIQNNITNNTITNNTNTIVINGFGNERLDYIEPAFILKCIKKLYKKGDGVPMMIEKIHLNKEVPENNNVLVDSLRRDQLKLYEGDRWNVYSKSVVFDRMIDNVRDLMHKFYNSPEGEELKTKDETKEYNRFYIQLLLDLINIVTEKKHYIYRHIYGKVINFHKSLLEDKEKLA